MRYEKADILLQLALEFQASRCGISLTDIEQKFTVSRRTAMRMRDATQRAFPQLQLVDTGERTKRWPDWPSKTVGSPRSSRPTSSGRHAPPPPRGGRWR